MFDMFTPENMEQPTPQTGDMLNFVLPKNQSSYIKVMGVGGGGSNAVNHMYKEGIQGVDFVVCNTDAQALESSPVPNKIQLGRGLGAGNMPDVAKAAALEKSEEIKEALQGTKMLFLTAGMGGGTGTGASPVVAQIAKEIDLVDDEVKKILTVAIVTTPFSIEGRKRLEQAKTGIAELRKAVDAILIINNDQLLNFGKMTLMQAFAMADNVLTTAAKGIAEIITVKSYVQIDFKDVNTVMQNSGQALMGFGTAVGENRAKEAVEAAMDSPLLNNNNIEGAKNVLLYLSYGPEAPLDMDEFGIITSSIKKRTGLDSDMIWGAGEDADLGAGLNITLIATGFSKKDILVLPEKPRVMDLEETPAAAVEVKAVEVRAEEIRPEVKVEPVELVGEVQAEEELQAEAVLQEETVMASVSAKQEEKQIIFSLENTEIPDFTAEKEVYTEEVAAQTIGESFTMQEHVPVMGGDDESSKEIGKEVEEWISEIDVLQSISEAEQPVMETAFEPQAQEPEMEIFMAGEKMPEVHMETVRETVSEPKAGNMFKDWSAANAERVARLHEIAGMIRTQKGLHEIESVPAYQRQNVELTPVLPSDESEASRTMLGHDGTFRSTPPFLSEKAD